MTQALIDAAEQLADALTAENVALEAMDFPAAAALLDRKAAAAAAFTTAQSAAGAAGKAGGATATALLERAQELGRSLEALARANRTLLERAMIVQGRVIGIVAGAARQATPMPGYGIGGRPAPAGRAAAYALVARA